MKYLKFKNLLCFLTLLFCSQLVSYSQVNLISLGFSSLRYQAKLSKTFTSTDSVVTKNLMLIDGLICIGDRLAKIDSFSVNLLIGIGFGYNTDTTKINILFTFPTIFFTMGVRKIGVIFGIRFQNWYDIKVPGYPEKSTLEYPRNLSVYQYFGGVYLSVLPGMYIGLDACYNFYSKSRLLKFSSKNTTPMFEFLEFSPSLFRFFFFLQNLKPQ
ncbi:hypothetical protein JGI3_02260 [Candidatus Kryptobacter tengchongensis]|nr:hypothetical protein JGI3_02260 [Candidatus Kryptobacter tengchongensis]